MLMFRFLFSLIFIFLITVHSAFGDQDRREPLNIVYCEYLPFYFKGGNGDLRGIFVDFWKLWSEKTGVPVEFSLLPWEEAVQQVRDGKIDINAAVFHTPERDKYLDFSMPFFDVASYLFHHVDARTPSGPHDLAGYRFGTVSGDFSANYLRKNNNVAPTEYISHERLVTEAISGKIDAFIMEDPVAMTYLAKHNGLKNIQKTDMPVYTQQFRSGVREGNNKLLSVINNGLNLITRKEIDHILGNWIGEITPKPAEQYYEKLVIATSIDQIPFHFLDDNGRVLGMLIDLWRLWAQKSGTEITFKSATWSESLKMVQDGTADIHAGCFYSKERDEYLDYAAPLKECATHFFFHQSIFGLKNLEDLIGFKIGALKNDYAVDFVRQELPGAYVSEYSSNQALFDAVEKGDVRVFVGDTPTALFFLSKKGLLSEYRHHPARPLYSNTYMGAVKEGDSALVSAINYGFSKITAKERATIERRWVGTSDYKTEDVMVIACEKAYPPFSMLNSEGSPSGMFIDFWRLWAQKTGRKIEFRVFTRTDAVNALSVGGADIHSGLRHADKQENFFAFSQPFYRIASHLFYRADGKKSGIKDGIDDLNGRTIGTVRNTATSSWLHERVPPEQIKTFATEEELIIAAANREIDIFAAPLPVMLAFFSRHGRMSEFGYHPVPLFTRGISGAIIKKNQELLPIINAGMNAISHKEMVEMESSWITDGTLRYYKPRSKQIVLSEHEKQWIRNHGEIRLGVPPDLPPFDFIDQDGTYMGIASDYVRRLNERLGLHIELVPNLTWSEVISKAKAGKRGIDLISSAVRTDEMKNHMLFTNPYTSFPWVIITRKDTPLIGGLRDLYGKRSAVIRDYAMHERLFRDHPDIPLLLIDSVASGLKVVSQGKAEAYVGNLAAAGYSIQSKNFTDLKIAASTAYGNEGISFAVRSDWPELVGILNKGIATISSPERDRIRQRWFSVRFEHGIDRAYIWKVIIIISGTAGLLFILFFLWNRQMHKARNAAEAANSAKSEFLASLSHEIRTPMNVIMGMTDITLRTCLDSSQKENLRTAREAAGHLLELIDDILDLSKIEAGKVKVVHIPFDLDKLLHGIITTYTTQARKKGLLLKFEKSSRVPQWVKGDPVRLRQILVNLIGNAIKFTGQGFIKIYVNVKEGETEVEQSRKTLCFSVQDSGIGISPDKLSIIFDSFTRVGRTSVEKYGGTGLGLAICKKFAELMGGFVSVKSDLGKGSTFYFKAPFEQADEKQENILLRQNSKGLFKDKSGSGQSDEKRPEHSLHILLAEDSGPNAAVAISFLTEMGHTVATASNGNQVILQLSEQQFDLVLMDVEMPELDGLEATRQIRKGTAGLENRTIPIIAITAHALDEYREKCKDAGMNFFLPKPIDFKELANAIDRNSRNFTPVPPLPVEELQTQYYQTEHSQPNHHDLERHGANMEKQDDTAPSLLLDREGALNRLGNNEELLNEIYTIFLKETPGIMEKLRSAIDEENPDMEAIFFSAHNLKSASERVGALSCRDIAAKLEEQAKSRTKDGVFSMAKALFNELEAAMAGIKNEK